MQQWTDRRLGDGEWDDLVGVIVNDGVHVRAPLVYGAAPIFVDIEPDTFCMNVELVEAALTGRTKAIIAVNLFGHPARLQALRSIADANGIYLIEDNAQAIGSVYTDSKKKKVKAGTIGHIGTTSFFPSKIPAELM